MSNNTFLREKAYTIIQSKILEGELRAGSLVSELTLAEEIGMSRTPVREAIGQLEREGLFNKVPRVGTIVRLPTYQELKDLYEVRAALESSAASIAVEKLSPGDFTAMKNSIEEVNEITRELRKRSSNAVDETLLRRFLAADIAFHLVIIQASGNARILEIVSEFRVIQRVFEYGRMSHNVRIIEAAATQHSEILDALKKGDGEAARVAMMLHIRTSQSSALASFEESHHPATDQVALNMVKAN